jgi:hypothetical protein
MEKFPVSWRALMREADEESASAPSEVKAPEVKA